ncbi:cytochrome c oxidase subunit 2A [Bacillus sp. Bva_UNVM-123]
MTLEKRKGSSDNDQKMSLRSTLTSVLSLGIFVLLCWLGTWALYLTRL